MPDAVLSYDAAARSWLAAFHTPVLDAVTVALSRAARGGLLWLALGVLLVLVRPRMASGVLQMALAVGLASLLIDGIVKPVVGRSRPFEAMADVRIVDLPPESSSFPSGHAGNAFAAAYALSRLVPAAQIPLWILAIAVSWSRIYVGVHFPLDVAAGALIGLACGIFVVGGSRWYSVGPAARTPPVPR